MYKQRLGTWMAACVLVACGSERGPERATRDAAVEEEPATGCSEAQVEPGDSTIELQHGGERRTYVLHVPERLDFAKPAPLVLHFHGLGSNAAEQIAFSGFNETADAHGVVVAYPQGLSNAFNGGVCCSAFTQPPHSADDAGFAREVVADVSARLCIDERRVYSMGMSNGGYMSEYNACANADLFAAVAPVSAIGLEQPFCDPARPIPMLALNGTADGLVSYEGSVKSIEQWATRDGCTGEPEREDFGESYCDSFRDCAGGSEVTHCTLAGMGHCWPGTAFCPFGQSSTDIDANELIWAFFQRFELPE